MLQEHDNKEWISNPETPDPENLPGVLGWHILVRPVNIRNQIGTTGKLIMPEKTRDDIKYLNNVGRILSIGPLAFKDKEKFGEDYMPVKVGDYVTVPRFVGEKIVYKGVRMLLVEDMHLKLVLENPEDIDPTKNIEA